MAHKRNHATEHTDGTDDIQDATDSVKGLATSTQITKLDGIDAGADVTSENTCNTPGGAGTDTTAIHDNVANEITAISEKTTPVGDDELVMEDSADTGNKKSLKLDNVIRIHENIPVKKAILTLWGDEDADSGIVLTATSDEALFLPFKWWVGYTPISAKIVGRNQHGSALSTGSNCVDISGNGGDCSAGDSRTARTLGATSKVPENNSVDNAGFSVDILSSITGTFQAGDNIALSAVFNTYDLLVWAIEIIWELS